MNTGQQEPIPLDLSAFAEYLRQNQAVQRMVETIGVKQAVEAVGIEHLWAELSPEQREELFRLAQKDHPVQADQPK